MVLTHRIGFPILIALLMSAPAFVGCGDEQSPTAPSATEPPPQSSPPPTGVQPTVGAITPNIGSSEGGSWGTITGSEFQPGATVTLGNNVLRTVTVRDNGAILFWTYDPHAAGTVDVIVTNQGGLSSRLSGGFTYAQPESLDFNGDWIAYAGPHYETDMRFTIRNNELVSFSCDASGTLTPSTPAPVRNGEFSFGDEGLAISGRVVSPVNAVGTINTPLCASARWWANRN